MKTTFLRLAACLPILALAEGSVLSGKVTDMAGKPLAGVWVGLAQAQVATLTAADGSWSIGATGTLSRTGTRALATRHLVREGNRLKVSFDGRDIFGRNLSGIRKVSPSSIAAARAAEGTPDTLLYVRETDLLASTPVTTDPFDAGTVALDTGTVWTYTQKGDTMFVAVSKGTVDVSCRGEALHFEQESPYVDTNLVRLTADGLEMVSLNADLSSGPYQNVGKFRRLDGTASSLTGRFQLVGEVYRTTLAISDSIKAILAEDSIASAAKYARTIPVYDFAAGTISLVGAYKPSYASTFVQDWSHPQQDPWIYSDADSTWVDTRQWVDSARYDIAVKIVDSNTVTLTGNVNHEVVTLVATPTLQGFDLAFSSTDTSRTPAKIAAIPTTCPNSAEMFDLFEWANFLQSDADPGLEFAARKASRSKAPPTVRRRHFPF